MEEPPARRARVSFSGLERPRAAAPVSFADADEDVDMAAGGGAEEAAAPSEASGRGGCGPAEGCSAHSTGGGGGESAVGGGGGAYASAATGTKSSDGQLGRPAIASGVAAAMIWHVGLRSINSTPNDTMRVRISGLRVWSRPSQSTKTLRYSET